MAQATCISSRNRVTVIDPPFAVTVQRARADFEFWVEREDLLKSEYECLHMHLPRNFLAQLHEGLRELGPGHPVGLHIGLDSLRVWKNTAFAPAAGEYRIALVTTPVSAQMRMFGGLSEERVKQLTDGIGKLLEDS